MIQLVFDARDAQEALSRSPVEVGYSSHEGAERAEWGDDKLELVDGTHPVVFPAAGSHANKYTEALYLGSSAEAGVGCDDTRSPHVELRPVVRTIPSDPAAAARAFPWIGFQGRWGERQKAFFNGPTGPNLKTQWTEPIAWAQGWHDRSYAVPTGGVFGTGATDLFCAGVAAGSRGLIAVLRDPVLALLLLAALFALVVFLVTRTTWRPSTPLSVARRRTWGQVLSAAARMYAARPLTFLGIGAVFIPIGAAIAVVQSIIVGGFGLAGIDATGEAAGALVALLLVVGTTLAVLGFTIVQAATACAVTEIEAGRSPGPLRAYAAALRRIGPLLGATAVGAAVWLLLNLTTVLIPVAIWLVVRWILLAQVVELEEGSAFGALRRSAALVRGRWLRVASLVGVGAVLTLAAGPLVGALLIFVTDVPLALLNVIAGFVYALATPFVALTATYVYFDARVHEAEGAGREPTRLPPEADVGRLTAAD